MTSLRHKSGHAAKPAHGAQLKGVNAQLRRASAVGSQAVIKALLLLTGHAAVSRGYDGMTALMYAARGGHAECVQLLLPASDALAQDDNGINALMWAAFGGHARCVLLLLPVSNALASDDYGRTARMFAANAGRVHVEALIGDYFLAQDENSALAAFIVSVDLRSKSSLRV